MNFVDYYSLTLHRAIAEKMIRNGDNIVKIALGNIERWLKLDTYSGPEAAPLLEWKHILETSSIEEIRRIITADTDEGQRLRSSTPFTGVLTKSEREKYWSECAEVRPV
jgi:hypothetical protein